MYLNKNDNTVIRYKQEITVSGVTYPSQVFDDATTLAQLNIVVPTVGAQPDPINNTYTESIDYTTDTVSYVATPIAPVVPASITRVQAMKQLKVLTKWTVFKAVLATNVDAQDEWDLATELQRGNPFVAMLAPALNMTDADLDNLFIEASKL